MAITITQGISKPNGITDMLTGISNAGGISAQGGGPTPPPPVSCAYPLDGDVTGSPFQPMGISGVGLQTATVTLAGAGSAESLGAFPSGAFPGPLATLDLSTGIRVVGFYPIIPAAVNQASSLAAYSAGLTLATTAFSAVLGVDITATTGGLFDIVVSVGATTAYTATGQASVPSFIAMIFNANTSTVSVQFDGTPVSLTADSYTPDTLIAGVFVSTFVNTVAGDIGKTIGGRLATHAHDFTGDMPGGSTSVCGEAFEVFYLTDSVGDYPTDDAGDYLIGA